MLKDPPEIMTRNYSIATYYNVAIALLSAANHEPGRRPVKEPGRRPVKEPGTSTSQRTEYYNYYYTLFGQTPMNGDSASGLGDHCYISTNLFTSASQYRTEQGASLITIRARSRTVGYYLRV